MADHMRLILTPGDSRLLTLEGVGTLRPRKTWSGTAEASGHIWQITWRFSRGGVSVCAADEAERVIGRYTARWIRVGGAMTWSGREFDLRLDSQRNQEFALIASDRTVARMTAGRSARRGEMTVDVAEVDSIDPGLLLFATFVALKSFQVMETRRAIG